MRVPFAPTAFPSEQQIHLLYELHLTNFRTASLYLRRIEVRDADASAAPPIAAFTAEQLTGMVQTIGSKAPPVLGGNYEILGGGRAIVFVSIALEQGAHVPDRLLHRVLTAESVAEGAVITTHHTPLHVLGPPVDGANWVADEGPSNDNHHRRGIIVLRGEALISGRYAIDWKQVEHGARFSGDPRDVHSYYAYGKPVLAVADGRIVYAKDGLPDNVPRHDGVFQPAVPTTMETQAGNTVVLDLGDGQFAHYVHLQPGSVRVKTGQRVRRGQMLARIGSSGDSRGPHLHFDVTTSPERSGEGVPYVIDSYSGTSASGQPMGLRKQELPLNNTLVVFPDQQEK